MKDKIYNPASTTGEAPAEGMAAVNTWNSEELDKVSTKNDDKVSPKNIDREDTSHDANKPDHNERVDQ
jgi:hypothetical protein